MELALEVDLQVPRSSYTHRVFGCWRSALNRCCCVVTQLGTTPGKVVMNVGNG
ncbi:hypothetical protein J6590_079158 [Homalodisca vitripennis]|nr:hypothetical protein J6590_079158 [Homalodisca vitripennis]